MTMGHNFGGFNKSRKCPVCGKEYGHGPYTCQCESESDDSKDDDSHKYTHGTHDDWHY